MQGGISNGEDIFFRVAFKPTSTIARDQKTVTASGEETTLAARGRHDPCVLPRAVPIVEAMAALVLCDHALRQRARFRKDKQSASAFPQSGIRNSNAPFLQSKIRNPKSHRWVAGLADRFSCRSRPFSFSLRSSADGGSE